MSIVTEYPRCAQRFKKSAKKQKQYLDEVYRSSGDICFARPLSELPSRPRDIYNARATSRKLTTSSNVSQSSSTKLDEVWVLLEKAKVEKDESAEFKFIQNFRVHPNFSTVLPLERQLEEIVTFCTDPKEFINFYIDPTSNIFTENISLTKRTRRNWSATCFYRAITAASKKKDGKHIPDLRIV